jgi:hypothetical protein
VPTTEDTRSARLARAYAVANRRFEQAQRLQSALFRGAWLGVLDRDALAAIDGAYYASHREETAGRALRYADPEHIHSGLTEWEARALQAHFPPGGRLIVTSAGAGREVLGAIALGFDATGYEPHVGLRAAGNAERPGTLLACGRDVFPADTGRADGVIVGWGGFSHIQGRRRRVAFLTGARAALAEGAPLLVSFWMLPERPRYLWAAYRAASLGRRLTGGEPVEPGDLLSPIFVHCFSEEELRAECAAAGFAVEAFAVEPYPHAVARAA